jgi:hypothetical protein
MRSAVGDNLGYCLKNRGDTTSLSGQQCQNHSGFYSNCHLGDCQKNIKKIARIMAEKMQLNVFIWIIFQKSPKPRTSPNQDNMSQKVYCAS